ncbi:hypothetical protein MACJ_003430 [Theileria orientalis]|uniref:Uncharacterized protein n=1 Tax=Theileria orientalis TaxID=68886 RepID=A0A976SKE4_THEOR|nr:hypothetical protein MACJ_003430 [Theileria orientalis]
MDNITFDLNRRDGNSYVIDGKEIHVLSFTNNFKHYCSRQHIYGPPKPSENIKFNIKSIDGKIIALSLVNLLPGPYNYLQLNAYYRDDNQKVGPIFLGVIVSTQTCDSTSARNVKRYYKFSDLTAGSDGDVVKLMNLSSVPPDQLNQDMLDEEYKLMTTTVEIDLHERHRFYKGGFTIGANGDNSQSFVSVGPPKHVTGFKDYFVYTHTPKVASFTKLAIKCSDDCCTMVDFNSSDFTRANTDKVLVYFCADDSKNNVPLLIGLIKSGDDGDTGVYYQLVSVYEDESKPQDRRWVKIYARLNPRVRNPELSLKAIHTDNKYHIDRIINRTDRYDPIMDRLMMGFGICTILLAFTATGIWIYLNLETAMGTMDNLYRRF